MLRCLTRSLHLGRCRTDALASFSERRIFGRTRTPLTGIIRSIHQHAEKHLNPDQRTPTGSIRYWEEDGRPTDALYDRYLGYPLRPNRAPASGWVHESDLAACLKVLPQHLRSDPLQCFSNGDADLSLAGDCLEAYVVGQHRQVSSLTEAKTKIASIRVGTRALLWLIKRPDYKQLDLLLHPRFLRALLHCLVAESSTSDILAWLRLPVGDESLSVETRLARSWKGIALRELLESSMFWAENDVRGAITVWAIALHQDKARHGPRVPPQQYTPKHQAGFWLMNRLTNGDNRHVDPKQYEAVASTINIFLSKDSTHMLYDTAQLDLQHPIEPSPDAGLKFLAAVMSPPENTDFTSQWLNPSNTKACYDRYFFLLKLAQCLNKRGQRDLAKGIIDFGIAKFPDYFRAVRTDDFGPSQDEVRQQMGYGAGERRSEHVSDTVLERRRAVLAAYNDLNRSKRTVGRSRT